MAIERIGLFGGTFDPPHVGHLILASEACAQLKLTRLLWVLTPDPPHKQGRRISSLDQRRSMVEHAIAGDGNFELSLVEVERPGPHYTLDTVRILRERMPGAELVLLIGGDSLRDLPSWHQPAQLVKACHEIGVMRRPQGDASLAELEGVLPGIKAKVRFVEAPLLQIASRDIRRRVETGEPFRYYLPPAVYEFIQSKGLYRSTIDE